MFVDITRILSKSPTLNQCVWNKNVFPFSKLIVTLLISNNDLAITLAVEFIFQCSPVPKLT